MASDFIATCGCEDWLYHKDYPQSYQEFMKRSISSVDLSIIEVGLNHGVVQVVTETNDSLGRRRYRVLISRGDGDSWMCKHLIAAVQTKALMPNRRFKRVFFTEQDAREFAKAIDCSIVTSVNQVSVVGYD